MLRGVLTGRVGGERSCPSPDPYGESWYDCRVIGRQKVTINLPASSWEAITERAARDGVNRGEAVRRALWLYTYVRTRQESGDELLLEAKDGEVQRIVLEVAEPIAVSDGNTKESDHG